MRQLPPGARVFITGAGSGLGRELALALIPKRPRLLLSDVNLDAAQATAELLAEQGVRAEVMRCDVAVEDDIAQANAQMNERYDGTDLLINNAGVAVAGLTGTLPMEDWQWAMGINLWGVIYGCHHFVPGMKAQGRGWILNVASSAGFAALPEMGPYNVSKAGVIALSETLSVELAPHQIKVSALCPTFFKTNLLDTLRGELSQRERAERMFARSKMTAAQVAQAGLRGLLAGETIIIPQADGKWLWRAKRMVPEQLRAQLSRAYRNGMFDKYL